MTLSAGGLFQQYANIPTLQTDIEQCRHLPLKARIFSFEKDLLRKEGSVNIKQDLPIVSLYAVARPGGR